MGGQVMITQKTSKIYPVASFIDARIDRDAATNTATVTVLSKIHKTREYVMPHSYSTDFSDAAILSDRDFYRVISPFLK